VAKITNVNRIHCEKRHVNAFLIKRDDGTFTVKCSLLKRCGNECPYLKDPNYKSEFRRAPEYKNLNPKKKIKTNRVGK